MSEAITREAVAALAEKLDGLDLSDAEGAALDALMARAADAEAEVEGFGVVFEVEVTYKPEDFGPKGAQPGRPSTEMKVAAGLGLFPSRNVWTDMRPQS